MFSRDAVLLWMIRTEIKALPIFCILIEYLTLLILCKVLKNLSVSKMTLVWSEVFILLLSSYPL